MKKENKGLKSINKSPNVDWRTLLFRPGIYHWKYYSKDIKGYYEYSLDESHSIEEIPPEDKCIEVELFKFPGDGPIDYDWKHINWQQELLGDYFHEAFVEWAFYEGAKLRDLFYSLIIPRKKYDEIIKRITEFELLHVKDLLLEAIAISQYIITSELSFWNTPENIKLVETAQGDTKEAIRVIELSGVHHKNAQSMIDNPSPGLSSITFVFNDKTKIKIQNKWLADEIVEHFMRYYDEMSIKGWRENLSNYPKSFNRKRVKVSFQKKIILAYFKMFTENKWLVSESKHPSRMMKCIVCMLEFSLSPVGKENYSDFRKGKIVSALLGKMGH